MPKAKLTFNLPKESEEFRLATNGSKLSMVITNVLEQIRSEIKYKNHPDEVVDNLEKIRNKIIGDLEQNDLLFILG